MSAALIEHEAVVRLVAFLAALVILFVVQSAWPLRRDGKLDKRSFANLGFGMLGAVATRLLFPVVLVAWAATMHGSGLFSLIDTPMWLEVLLAVVLLDVAIYWQHRLLHILPLLWQIHRVHHSDLQFDVTTGIRFHPFEILLSMLFKLGLISVLGPPVLAVILFELSLSLSSLFTHTDISFPKKLDRALRVFFVTPSMHRIHHSSLPMETNSNYSFHLSIWDRVFGTYRNAPQHPERSMEIGIETFRTSADQKFLALIIQPFKKR